jgi:hypothetical protein
MSASSTKSKTLTILRQETKGKVTVQTTGKQEKMVEFFDDIGWLGRAGRRDLERAVSAGHVELAGPVGGNVSTEVRLTGEKGGAHGSA